MVLRLVADVLCGLVKISVIHREGSIARLPVETLVILFIQGLDPLAAVCLDAFHEIGQGDGLGQGGEDVDMVARFQPPQMKKNPCVQKKGQS